MEVTLNELIAEIEHNNSGECSARDGYFELKHSTNNCTELSEELKKELQDDIDEVISDEMNHTQKFLDWSQRLSNIKSATS